MSATLLSTVIVTATSPVKVTHADKSNSYIQKAPEHPSNPTHEDIKTTGTWGTSNWNFNKITGVLTLQQGTLLSFENSPWNKGYVNHLDIKKIVLDGKIFAPADSTLLFSSSEYLNKYLKNVTRIEGMENLDTSAVTNMSSMFSGMSKLTSLDLSSFDTSRAITTKLYVGTMYNMFSNTPELSQIKLGSSFKFSGDGKEYIGLQNPPEGRTTGKWRNVGTGTVNDPKRKHIVDQLTVCIRLYGSSSRYLCVAKKRD
ncbi:BspA family leucine-rich repeat surface protein [Lactococcus lactis]|uniref:BspA family leucine-rich repeat surface protein n=1 Tax=Lactococcus lactis TaxID=1358 RepID=UPI00223AAF0F|nr:BspA family leucine-rich repeat surface protein [Lactococcus lactis]